MYPLTFVKLAISSKFDDEYLVRVAQILNKLEVFHHLMFCKRNRMMSKQHSELHLILHFVIIVAGILREFVTFLAEIGLILAQRSAHESHNP